MAAGCLHYQLYEPPRRRAAAMVLVRRLALFSDSENMNKLAPLYDSLEFSFLGYYMRVIRCRGYVFLVGRTGDVLFLA